MEKLLYEYDQVLRVKAKALLHKGEVCGKVVSINTGRLQPKWRTAVLIWDGPMKNVLNDASWKVSGVGYSLDESVSRALEVLGYRDPNGLQMLDAGAHERFWKMAGYKYVSII